MTPISQHHGVERADLVVFSARYAGFGKFQVDLQRQELFLEGRRVKLHAKVYQALTLLLSRAGEVVTREEVRKQLWPDTFLASLNLDANINTTMNKLRQVLGDALENPQYIETIPRRGYSFIANVQFSETSAVPTGNALRANAVAIPPKPRKPRAASTTRAPNPIGAYSQAVRGGDVIFVSGQIPIDPATQRIIEGDARQQTERVLKNIAQVLEAAGSGMNKVVRCGVFLKTMSDYAAMNEVFTKTFGPHPPARTTVEVTRLPKDSLVEIDAIALK